MTYDDKTQKQDEIIDEIRKLIINKGYTIKDSPYSDDVISVYDNNMCLMVIEFC